MEAQGNHTDFTHARGTWIYVTACSRPLYPCLGRHPDLPRGDRNASRGRLCYIMTSPGISIHVLRTLQALEPELRAAGVRHISVFGSVARGEDTATSDVDLALDLAPERTPPGFQFVAYIERLKQKLATALARDVDIVVLPARRPELRETLSREAIAAF